MATTLANISIKDSSSWNTYLNLIYPVGSVYFATNNTSPASRFGGTWSAVSGSRYLRLMNNAGTGGTNTTFKIPLSCMPAHTHDIRLAANAPIPDSIYNWDLATYACTYYVGWNDVGKGKDYMTSQGGGSILSCLPILLLLETNSIILKVVV